MGQRGVSRRIEDQKAPLHVRTPLEAALRLRQGSQAAAFVSEAQRRMPRINGALTDPLAGKSRWWPVPREELSGPAHT